MAKTYPQLKVVMPDKNPKGGELTEDPKALNFLKASVRVVVEHAIAVVKRLNVITHAYRNRTHQRADQFNMLTITESAQKKINTLIEQGENAVMGLRIGAQALSPLKVDFKLSFIAEEQKTPEDTIIPFDGFEVYIDPESAPYVEDVTVDFVDGLMGSGFKIESAHKLPPHLSGPMVEKVQAVIDTQINPAVASHGGYISLIDVKDNVVYVQLGGGCQGCGMADVTLKQGIETSIKAAVPEITAIYDVTDHADGKNPYYQPSK